MNVRAALATLAIGLALLGACSGASSSPVSGGGGDAGGNAADTGTGGAPDGCGGVCAVGTCGPGVHCVNGACVCDSTSCNGCCHGTVCQPGTSPTACGSRGASC